MKVLLSLLFISSSFAYAPSPESFFLNPSNKEISTKIISLKYSIEVLDEDKNEDTSEDKSEMGEPLKKFYVKNVFYRPSEGAIRFLSSVYTSPSFAKSYLKKVDYKTNLLSHLKKQEEIEKLVFYSLLMSLGLNRSDGFNFLLSRYSDAYHTNKNIVNVPKRNLLLRYKNYLQLVKLDPSLKEFQKSPMESDSPAEKERLKAILDTNYYKRSDLVKLQKENNQFLWKFDLDPFQFTMDNKTHNLTGLSFKSETKNLDVELNNYILFNGVHLLPKFIYIKSSGSKAYLVKFIGLSHLNADSSFLSKKRSELNKISTTEDLSWIPLL